MPKSDKPIICKTPAPCQDIILNRQPKIPIEKPKYFNFSLM